MLAQATAYGIGALMVVAGLNSFRAPAEAAKVYGLPYPAKSTPNPWQYVFAGRNIYAGVVFIVLGYMSDARTIGVVELLGSLVGFFDIAITLKMGPKGAWMPHTFGTAILLGVGTTLVFGGT
jgi:hypothetical protein